MGLEEELNKSRDQWGGYLGFVLAAAGSAIGLGNLWKFPYMAWTNNGGSFVLMYFICIVFIGLPIMLAEILIGRRAQASPVPAFVKLGFPKWQFIGWLGVIAGLVILAFYSVIAGWSISSLFQCLNWSLNGYTPPEEGAFGNFLAMGWLQIGLSLTFSLLTAVIVLGGISKGIEKATKFLMPSLFVILLILVGRSLFLPGFGEAMEFLFVPDFSKFSSQSILVSLGQAFFTLSLGMGAMITYGSYMKKKTSIIRASIAIVILDTMIALFACVIMYSIIFSMPDLKAQLDAGGGASTIGMLFVTIPNLFYTEMTGGFMLAPLFYVLVGFAALSSTISLLEVIVALLIDRMKLTRPKATFMAAGGTFLLTIFCALSLGASKFLSGFKGFGSGANAISKSLNETILANKEGVLSILDHVAANWFLPVGGLLITIFVGWILPIKDSCQELGMANKDGKPNLFYYGWLVLVRFVAPLGILWIIIAVFRGSDFS